MNRGAPSVEVHSGGTMAVVAVVGQRFGPPVWLWPPLYVSILMFRLWAKQRQEGSEAQGLSTCTLESCFCTTSL